MNSKDNNLWRILVRKYGFFPCRHRQTPHETEQIIELLLSFYLPRIDVKLNFVNREKVAVSLHIRNPN